MWKGAVGKRPLFLRTVQNTGAEAECSPHDETHIRGRVEGMILQIVRQVCRAHASAGARDRDDLCVLRESSEKESLFCFDHTIRVGFRSTPRTRRHLNDIELPIPSRPRFVFEYGVFKWSGGPPDDDDRDLHLSRARRMSSMTASCPESHTTRRRRTYVLGISLENVLSFTASFSVMTTGRSPARLIIR